MAKWEHKIIRVFRNCDYDLSDRQRGKLDDLVAEGWEITHVLSWGEFGEGGGSRQTAAGYFLMRREMNETSPGIF